MGLGHRVGRPSETRTGLVAEPAPEQQAVSSRLWGEGRPKVEPWLEPRLKGRRYAVYAGRQLVGTQEQPDASIVAELDDGTALVVDHVVLATGYRPDACRLPMLATYARG